MIPHKYRSVLLKLIIGKDRMTFDDDLTYLYPARISNIHSNQLGYYYFDFKRSVTLLNRWLPKAKFDQAGVLVSGHGNSRWGKTFSPQTYNPIQICQYALGNYALCLDTGEQTYKDAFMTQADWLANNQQMVRFNGQRGGVWEATYYFPAYFAIPPWRSALIQGHAIAVLLRAYQLSGDEIYWEAAYDAIVPFLYRLEEGGVCYIDSNGNVFFEEFAVRPAAHVLNGHLFALWSLYDFYRVTNDQRALDLFSQGCDTLQNSLHLYDTGYWSLYDLLTRSPALARYHRIHIEQLKVLYAMTSDPTFRSTADKWMAYWNSLRSQIIYAFLFLTRLGYWRFGRNWLLSRLRLAVFGAGMKQNEF